MARCNRWCAALLLVATGVSLYAMPARAGDFTDAAGRRVVLPDRISRILPAERNAEVLVFVLAPNKLAAMGRVSEGRPGRRRASGVPAVPLIEWGPRTTPANMAATARTVHPDLIIDAGRVTPDRAAFADQVQQQTGIPYILVDDSFARMPAMMRSMGAILQVEDHAEELATYAEHAIMGLRGRLLIRPANMRPRIYYGRGVDGLTTVLPGSPGGEAIDEAGAINVASPLGKGTQVPVSREQLAAWDPEIIIAEDHSFYNSLQRNPGWRRLSAVRNKRVYLEPGTPFGWFDDPTGVNRVIGLQWLSDLFYPDVLQEDLRSTTCEFYQKFYRIKLTNGQVEAMLRPAGARPAQTTYQAEPLAGLGVTPRAPAPSSAAGAIPGMPNMPPEGGPGAACTLPGGMSPTGLLQSSTQSPVTNPEMAPPAAPGVPAPGRRGRPPPLPPSQ
jgi:iron complex transport system substrate-binding protein